MNIMSEFMGLIYGAYDAKTGGLRARRVLAAQHHAAARAGCGRLHRRERRRAPAAQARIHAWPSCSRPASGSASPNSRRTILRARSSTRITARACAPCSIPPGGRPEAVGSALRVTLKLLVFLSCPRTSWGEFPAGSEFAGNSALFRENTRWKGLGFEGLAAEFPARASREFFCAEQGMCREFFARSRGFAPTAEKRGRSSPRGRDRPLAA